MLKGLKQFANGKKSKNITDVIFVIHHSQKDIFNVFTSVIKANVKAKQSGGFFKRIGKSMKSWIGYGETEELAAEAEERDFVEVDETRRDEVTMVIYSHLKDNIKDAVAAVNDIYKDEIYKKEIALNRGLEPQEKKVIKRLEKEHLVNVDFEQKKILIEGLSEDVHKVSDEIKHIIHESDEKIRKMEQAAQLSKVVTWQYCDDKGNFKNFPDMVNYEIECASTAPNKTVEWKFKGEKYKFDFEKSIQIGVGKDGFRKIKRKVIVQNELPPDWKPMKPGARPELVDVQAGTPEYTRVQGLFANTVSKPIKKIQRVQNQSLWMRYMVHKNDLEQGNRTMSPLERELWHGTTAEAIDNIYTKGLDRSYSGANATVYGQGAYFAVNANYSASDTYSRPDTKGNKHMFLCSVLTGDYTVGTRDMKDTPVKDANAKPPVRYDSVTNNMTNPTMFIIFSDTQGYPKYLVVF